MICVIVQTSGNCIVLEGNSYFFLVGLQLPVSRGNMWTTQKETSINTVTFKD